MKKLLLLSILLITVYSCSKDDNIQGEHFPDLPENIKTEKINDNVITFKATDSSIENVTETSVTINENDDTNNLKVGSVIRQNPNDKNPDGFARKITNIQKINGKIILQTEQAEFDEVYKELQINSPIEIDYSNLSSTYSFKRSNPIPVGIGLGNKDYVLEFKYDELNKDFSYEVVFKEKKNGVKGEIRFKGRLKIDNQNSKFIFNLKPGTDKVFLVQNGMKITYNSKVTVKGKYKKELEQIEVARIPVSIGLPTDFIAYPALVIKMGVSGEITAEMSVETTNTFEYGCSAAYIENNESNLERLKNWLNPFSETKSYEEGKWNTIAYSKLTSKIEPEGNLKLEVKGYFSPGIRIVFPMFRNVKAGLYIEHYLKFKAETEFISNKVDWELGFGIDAKAVFKVKELNKKKTFFKTDFESAFYSLPYKELTRGSFELPENIYDGDITLTTQQEVDDFGANNYTEITGTLRIGHPQINSNISSLNSLSSVTLIKGSLDIGNNAMLSSLTGLNNIRAVGSSLTINNNAILTSLSELNKITSIEDYLSIANNEMLSSLTGLNNINTIGSSLSINNNAKLNSLTGLNNINSIKGPLAITNNEMLSSLIGLNNLNTIDGRLTIKNNNELNSLGALNNTTSIGEDLFIEYNDKLTSLSGLNNLTSFNGFIYIANNKILTSLSGLDKLTTVTKLVISQIDKLTSLSGLDNIRSISGDLIVSDNKELITLNGLHNLESVDDIRISNNDKLTSLTKLEKLSTINGNLSITKNDELTSLSGLENISNLEGKIYIGTNYTSVDTSYGNLKLTNICGISHLITNNQILTYEYWVKNNAYNPTYEQIQNTGSGGCEQ